MNRCHVHYMPLVDGGCPLCLDKRAHRWAQHALIVSGGMRNPELRREALNYRMRRALSALGKKTKYKLGKGGFDPSTPHPGTQCDCTGFGAWVFHMSRNQGDKQKFWSKWFPWFESTAIYKAVIGGRPDSPFVQIPNPVPGCGVVYGDKGGKEGHFALITSAAFDPRGKPSTIVGIDCSPGNERATGDAIRHRDLSFMLSRPIVFFVLRQDLA